MPSDSGLRPPRPTPQPQPLGPFALLRALARNPIECWAQAHFDEPIVMGGLPFARVAVVSEPAAIRKILVEDPADFRKSALERRILSARLRDGLVAADGEQWASQRRMLAPFFGRKMLMQFAPAMAGAAAAVIERWRRSAGEVLECKAEMSALALDALMRSIFHDGLGSDHAAMCAAARDYFAVAGRIDPFDVIGLPDVLPRVTHWRTRTLLRPFDAALDAAIARRRRALDEHSREAPRDILGILLAARDPVTGRGLTEAEVKANVLTFFLAGQETTSTALTWAIYLLSQSPEWSERVAAEARRELQGTGFPAEGIADRLVETRAVLDEAMRLYPPIVGITRTASRSTQLAGQQIARNTLIVISPYVLHRHRLLWEDPDLFDPTRFLDRPLVSRTSGPGPGRGHEDPGPGATAADGRQNSAAKIDRYAYLPFGIGPRMCIGAGFALQEATLVLANVMRSFKLALAPGQTVWPQQRLTLRPRGPLLLRVEPR
jgi:cytochrome P450